MVSTDDRYILSYNGEIYNYQELKRTFPISYPYVGTSTTEVLGNGMFNAHLIEKQFYNGNHDSETQALQSMNIATIEACMNKVKGLLR